MHGIFYFLLFHAFSLFFADWKDICNPGTYFPSRDKEVQAVLFMSR